MSPSTLFVWLLTCGIWSTVWLFIKLGVTDVPPVTFAAFRLGIALAIMVPATRALGVPLPRERRDWILIGWTGLLLLGVNYALLNWGMQFISSGLTAVLQAMTPAFGFLFAHTLLHDEKMTPLKAVALAVGIFGVGIIFSNQLEAAGLRALLGSVAVVGGAVCVAFAYVVMRRRGRHLHPGAITTGQMASAFVPLLVYAVIVEGNPLTLRWTRTAVLSGLYLALLGSIAAAWLNYWLLHRIGATKLLIMGLVEPLIAVLLGAAVLGETMTARAAIGGAAILVSVVFVLDLVPAFVSTRAARRT